MELFIDILKDTTIDTVKLIPFLFLTYLAMEYLENKAGQKALFRSADFRQQQQICIPAESSQLER